MMIMLSVDDGGERPKSQSVWDFCTPAMMVMKVIMTLYPSIVIMRIEDLIEPWVTLLIIQEVDKPDKVGCYRFYLLDFVIERSPETLV